MQSEENIDIVSFSRALSPMADGLPLIRDDKSQNGLPFPLHVMKTLMSLRVRGRQGLFDILFQAGVRERFDFSDIIYEHTLSLALPLTHAKNATTAPHYHKHLPASRRRYTVGCVAAYFNEMI